MEPLALVRRPGRRARRQSRRRRRRPRPRPGSGAARRPTGRTCRRVQRSKRAWCQWQVRIPSHDRAAVRAGSPCAGSGCRPRAPRPRRRGGRRCARRRRRRAGPSPRSSSSEAARLRCAVSTTAIVRAAVEPQLWFKSSGRASSRSARSPRAAASRPRRCASTSAEGLIALDPHRRQPAPLRARRRCAGSRSIQAGRAAGISLERDPRRARHACRRAARRAAATGSASRTAGATTSTRASRRCRRCASRLTTCIGCGCLSIDKCELLNPDDEAAAAGAGAHYLRGSAQLALARAGAAPPSTLPRPRSAAATRASPAGTSSTRPAGASPRAAAPSG